MCVRLALRVSMPCTMHPQSPTLTIGRTMLKESDDLDKFGVTSYYKMNFEKHLHSVSRSPNLNSVSWYLARGSPGEYSIIGASWNTSNYWTVQSVVPIY